MTSPRVSEVCSVRNPRIVCAVDNVTGAIERNHHRTYYIWPSVYGKLCGRGADLFPSRLLSAKRPSFHAPSACWLHALLASCSVVMSLATNWLIRRFDMIILMRGSADGLEWPSFWPPTATHQSCFNTCTLCTRYYRTLTSSQLCRQSSTPMRPQLSVG